MKDTYYLTHVISPRTGQKSREFNVLVVLEVTYPRRQVTLVCSAVTSKNDVTLCKLDVNVKKRTAVASSFFKLEQNFFTGKSVTLKQALL